MKPKTILTVLILAFVAVAVGYLVVKEVRAARAPEVAAAGPPGSAPFAAAERESGTGGTEASTAPATPAYGDEASDEGATPSVPDRKVVVTYYYTSKR